MPYWDGIWDSNRADSYVSTDENWGGLHLYCDLVTRDTVAQMEAETWEGDTEWCAYRWAEAGNCQMAATTDELWWMLDDLLWGPCYWERHWPDGREMTEVEDRVARGLPADDLLYDLEMAKIGELMKKLRPGWTTD